jgi:hypothetical protein
MCDSTLDQSPKFKLYQFNVLLTFIVGIFTAVCWFLDYPQPASNIERAPALAWSPQAQEILLVVLRIVIFALGTVITWSIWNRVLAGLFARRRLSFGEAYTVFLGLYSVARLIGILGR